MAIFGIPSAPNDSVGDAGQLGFVTIDSPNNPADKNGCGRVGYPYKITKQEVDNRTYAEFLNAADPGGTNTKALYNPQMTSSPQGGIIFSPSRAEGSRYQVKPGMADSPITFVDWFDAARFANWLNNGGRRGSSTETGAYNLRASKGKMAPRTGASRFSIPNQDELYKAAFYLPTGLGQDGDPERLYTSPEVESSNPLESGAIYLPVVSDTIRLLVDPYDVKDGKPSWTLEDRGNPPGLKFSGEENPDAESGTVGFHLVYIINPEKYAEEDSSDEEEEFAGAPGLNNLGFTPSFPAPAASGAGFGGVFAPISIDLPPSS